MRHSSTKFKYASPLMPLIMVLTGSLFLSACNETKTDEASAESSAAVSGSVITGSEKNDSDYTTAEYTTTDDDKRHSVKLAAPIQIGSPHDTEFDNFESLYLTTEASDSIWPRLTAGFKLPDDIDHKDLKTEIDWFARHPEYMQRVMQRADPFIFYIIEEAEKRNLPTELVLLPVVESAYQPYAYSHGRAAGIWQFIPSTGKIYGLKQNWWYDGRRDIYASTQAALDYLENLGKMFDGDWMLALASYNSGSGTVRRAIRNNKKQNKPTDFWHLKLPKETRAYVPKLLALKAIIENPTKYGISLRCISDTPGFKKVDINAQIDLALAAELADIDMQTLYRYNPAFNRWATDPNGPHRLLLPIASADLFEENYAALPADEHLRWARHKIKSGETLGHIAQKYKTSVKHLKKVNNIRGNNIRAGHYLMIPMASKNSSTYALSSSQRLKSVQNKKQGNKTRVNHIVQRGESFWDISRKYKVDMHKLAKWNGMVVKDPLKQGQKLVVWTNNTGASTQLAATHNPNSTIKSIHYTVRNGDSLSRIASKYNVDIKDLHRWNKIRGKYIQPGQRLKLYIDVTEQSGRAG